MDVSRRPAFGGGVMLGFGLGVAAAPTRRTATAPTATTAPVRGLFLNGSTNAAFKAAVARVRAGSGRGKVLFKGDSTTVGQGGGAGTSDLVGARANRPSTKIAAALTAAGVPALDVGLVGDGGVTNGGVSIGEYDPRVTQHGWTREYDQTFAGGGLLKLPSTGGDQLIVAYADAVDSFEVVHYCAGQVPYAVTIDGGATITAGSSGVGTANGFGRTVQVAAAPAAGRSGIMNTQQAGANQLAICSLRAWNGAVPALDFVVDACCGATAAQQLGAANTYQPGWSGQAHLRFEAPDLTIINVGINDLAQGVALADTIAAIGAGVTAAKASGDVLLVVPHAFDTAYNAHTTDAAQQALNDAIKALAAQNGVACLSLYETFGSFASTSAMLVDGVHPNAAFYASIAAAETGALHAMLAA